jgi:CDP-diacylglycerol---glycerol-3-phosphate 3-phosphatidyltransferase
MSANWITLSRFPLLLLWILILYLGSPALQLAGVAVLLLGLFLDTVDGVVARRAGQTSLFGSVLDIAADRTYELVLWVCFADLGMISSAVPLIVVARTTLTDALRSLGVAAGAAPFDQHRTTLARWVVGSTWMRTGYSLAKVVAFGGLALAHALAGFPPEIGLERVAAPMLAALQPVVWLAVALCVFRGLPVLLAGIPRLRGA